MQKFLFMQHQDISPFKLFLQFAFLAQDRLGGSGKGHEDNDYSVGRFLIHRITKPAAREATDKYV